ncbi:MAG TPA: ATP-dependent DNA helicase RecQ [Tepidisphaeraceae bacterium]
MATMTTSPAELLQQRFGFPAFRPGQEAVVSRLLDGRSVLAVFPTGAGKSLCYQLPALMLDGTTLVISPLIALMKDQIDFLKARGIAADRLDSTLEFEESRRVLRDLAAGRLKLLYIAPERLASERFLQSLRRIDISMLAVDEAHCISEWGHNFRPDYMKLASLARSLNVSRVLALTATATPDVADSIARVFDIADDDIVRTPFHRPNLTIRVTPAAAASNAQPAARNAFVLDRIRSRPPGPTIVYVTLQKTAEDVAAFLKAAGLRALAYHAGLNAETRHSVQDTFMESGEAIVVATIAFGMGIDKRDIRYVYHYNLPKSLENYAQEIGRAGRDGQPAICELLADPADRIPLENFTYGDTPGSRAIHALLSEIFDGQRTTGDGPFDVSVYDLSGRHDIRPLVVETVLTYLELDGLIASTGPFYDEYKFQPLRPSGQMLARFDAERQAFIRAVLKCAIPGKTWFKLELTHVTRATGVDRQRIVAALNYLEEQGDLKLQVAGARQGYRMLRRDADLNALAATLADRFGRRERRDLERLSKVLDFAAHDDCRTRYLLNYFGESLDRACGHCDACAGDRPSSPVPAAAREIDDQQRHAIRALKSQRHAALATPRQLARFLCGITSPATTRAKLTKSHEFAMLADLPFATVLEAVKR